MLKIMWATFFSRLWWWWWWWW